MTWKRLGALALAVMVSAPAAVAEDLVYFQNGQAMRVDKTRREGKWLYLTLAAEQEMAVLARQVKKVEPAPTLPGGAHSGSMAANLVQSSGGGGYVPAAPIAESYDATEMGEEPQVVQPTPDQLQQQQIQQQMQQAAQGADLVPRNPNIRRAGRPRR